jgi:hypothetical protein
MTSPHTAGRAESPIPTEIFERAEILMDQFRHIEDDRELIARVLMEVERPQRFGLTPAQGKALSFIRDYTRQNGASPSYFDIAKGLGFASKGPAHALVHQLVERGAVHIARGRARSITVLEGI